MLKWVEAAGNQPVGSGDGYTQAYNYRYYTTSDPATRNMLVLMLTAKTEETDEVVGFSVGTDDYVAKPFSVKVLLERLPTLFNWVVIDSPPMLFAADANLLATITDATLLVVRLGQPIRVVTEPGLNYKVPLIDTVIAVDKRILDLEDLSQ